VTLTGRHPLFEMEALIGRAEVVDPSAGIVNASSGGLNHVTRPVGWTSRQFRIGCPITVRPRRIAFRSGDMSQCSRVRMPTKESAALTLRRATQGRIVAIMDTFHILRREIFGILAKAEYCLVDFPFS
jgi:hypothetical protein